jgi:hypothetical protein
MMDILPFTRFACALLARRRVRARKNSPEAELSAVWGVGAGPAETDPEIPDKQPLPNAFDHFPPPIDARGFDVFEGQKCQGIHQREHHRQANQKPPNRR